MDSQAAFQWDRLLEVVRSEAPELYRAWFTALEPGELHGGTLVVRVADAAQAHYLQTNCRHTFAEAAMKLTGCLVTVEFVCSAAGAAEPTDARLPWACVPLSADYTFDQFVVGASNRLAHAACGAVVRQLGTLYNPLFIHGASGLGKTHLLQATCAEVLQTYPERRVLYLPCETFVNEFVRALASGQWAEFRESVRQVDVLAIDDVQFLANRESSQEELFHTFNALYQARRQIILSADAAPADIPTLEDRLVSRFSWGLVIRIDPPTRETRQAILHQKARLRGVVLPDEVIDYLASHVDGNIRLLEGTLTRLITEAQLAGQPLTLATVRELLAAPAHRTARPLQISDILHAVSEHCGVRLQELLGRKRTRSVTLPRQLAMYLARRLTPLSLEEIGMHFAGRDHSTVLHAERTIEEQRANNPQLAQTLTILTERLLNRR